MLEKEIHGRKYFQLEMDDILTKATDLGDDCTIEGWPWGRKQKCTMHFFVESGKKGQRFVKQSTFNGRTYKPKRSTYASQVTIIKIDDKIGRAEWNEGYQLLRVKMEDGKYLESTFFEDDGQVIADYFFGQ